eukprot:GEZU01025123.1.p1 GENE.GEZU01025123.1~~GEZU01025123.1.p1  ORF type:complete len:177 (-),score=20.27 GEZU01025123.1:482-1012(-)
MKHLFSFANSDHACLNSRIRILVPNGHCAVKFHRINGVEDKVYHPGRYIIYPLFNVMLLMRTEQQCQRVTVPMAVTKDSVQMKLEARVCFRPDISRLPQLYIMLGPHFGDIAIPSLANEAVKAVVEQHDSYDLLDEQGKHAIETKIQNSLNAKANNYCNLVDDFKLEEMILGDEMD